MQTVNEACNTLSESNETVTAEEIIELIQANRHLQEMLAKDTSSIITMGKPS